MNDTVVEAIERVAESVIREAGNLILNHLGTIDSSQVQSKGKFDFVTEVDTQSEAMILERIRRHFPDHHIVSEETANTELRDGINWIIDPLDGTTNFIHGFPFVAVSIGVCEDRKMMVGMVLDLVRKELFSAVRGKGAYLNGRRIQVRSNARLDDALIATGFPFRSQAILEPYLDVFRRVSHQVSGIRRAGSAALDLAYLAAGRVDGFWEVGLKPWDVAAGSLLVTEAGGQVSDFWETENYLYNGHIVGGTEAVYPLLLKQVKEFLVPALE